FTRAPARHPVDDTRRLTPRGRCDPAAGGRDVIADGPGLRYATTMADSARRDEVEPRFVIEERERGADPLAVYAETYRAMDAEGGRRRTHPLRGVLVPIVLGFGVIVATIEVGSIVRTQVGAVLSA